MNKKTLDKKLIKMVSEINRFENAFLDGYFENGYKGKITSATKHLKENFGSSIKINRHIVKKYVWEIKKQKYENKKRKNLNE